MQIIHTKPGGQGKTWMRVMTDDGRLATMWVPDQFLDDQNTLDLFANLAADAIVGNEHLATLEPDETPADPYWDRS
jgi:hypothetical protein